LVGAPVMHQLKSVKKILDAKVLLAYMVNSTIGSFCQLSVSHKDFIKSEMIRMRIRRYVLPQMDVYNKLSEYCNTMERKKKNQDKVSPNKGK
jgi:hypothetical protein